MAVKMTGLRRGVVLFALAAIVFPLATLGYLFISYYDRTTTAEIMDENRRLSLAIRNDVNNFLSMPLALIEVAAEEADNPAIAPHMDGLLSRLAETYGIFESIMVLDRNGIVRHIGASHGIDLSRNDYLGLDLSASEHVVQAWTTRRHSWSNTYISPLTGLPTLSLVVPFAHGMAVGNINLTYLRTIIALPLPHKHDLIYLVNNRGRIIAHPDFSKVLQQVNVSNISAVRAGLDGQEGIFEYEADGTSLISAETIIPETGWLVIVERNAKEVLAQQRFLKRVLVTAILISFALIGVLVWYVNKRLIRPVTAISAATKNIAGGSFQVVPVYHGQFTELADLTGNFNDMTTSLQTREQELADKNRELEEEIDRRIQSEEEVRQSEQRLELILENSPFAVYVLNYEGKGLYVNKSAELISGYTREELLGMRFTDFVHPEDRETLMRRRENRLAGKPAESRYEFRIQDRAGNIHWIENNVITLFWEEQPATFNFLQEITERKQAEEALQRSQQLLRSTFASLRDAFFLIDADTTTITECNPAASTVFGYSIQEMVGRTTGFLHVDETTLAEFRRRLGAAVKEKGFLFLPEFSMKRKDGTVFLSEHSVMPIEKDGRVMAWVSVVRDITERKQAEKDLKDSEQFSNTLLESLPGIFFFYEMDAESPERSRLIRFNRNHAEVTGYSPDELRSMTIVDWFEGDMLEKAVEAIREGTKGGMVQVLLDLRMKDGTKVPYFFTGRTLIKGGMPCFLGVGIDMSDYVRAQEALQESEAFRKRVFESSRVPIVVMDAETYEYIDCNPAAVEIYRFASREATLGRTPLDVSAPVQYDGTPSTEKAKYYIDRALTEGTVVFEWRHQRPDGDLWDAEVHLMSFASGERRFLQFTLQDITDRKNALEAVEKSEERYRSLFESAGDAIFLMDRERIVTCNSQTLEMFRCTRDQILGSRPDEFSPLLQPDGRGSAEKAREVFQRALDGEAQRFEWKHVRYDGTPFDAEVTLSRLAVGSGRSLQAIVRDISERKKTAAERENLIAEIQAALESVSRAQKEWRDTFDNITDMISIHDKDYNIIRANKAFSKNLGMEPRDVINRKCYDLMHNGATAPVAGCPHQKTLEKQIAFTEEVFDEKLKKTFRVTTYPYFSPDGGLIGTIHIARDITEEKEREMGLIMTERLASLGQMASGIAHEINNPLESVMICAEMLLLKVSRDAYDHAQFEKYLKIIDEEVLRCRDITGTMLSFARRSQTEHQDVDLHPLLDKAVDLVGYQGRLKNVEVIKRYGEVHAIRGNEGELRQVFLVLIINALDAMENKGILTIETGSGNGRTWVRITDTGPGIPSENLQKIFQPFFTTKTGSGGTGLGLSIAHRIISHHQGSIDVSSEAGRGASFTVSYPS